MNETDFAYSRGFGEGWRTARTGEVDAMFPKAMIERAAAAYEIGGVCAPHGKCGGGCQTAHIHRMRLAVRAALEVTDG